MATGLAAAAARRRLLLLPRHRLAHLLHESHLSSSTAPAEGMDGGDGGGGRVKIFDRDLKRWHRDQAAWALGETNALADVVADNLFDRLEDCRKAFPSALCLGGSAGVGRRVLRRRGGIEKLIMMDMSADMVRKWREMENATNDVLEMHFVVGDEEFLPIKESHSRHHLPHGCAGEEGEHVAGGGSASKVQTVGHVGMVESCMSQAREVERGLEVWNHPPHKMNINIDPKCCWSTSPWRDSSILN